MTKPVTSIALMMLAEEGKLDIAAPVSQYLPQLKDLKVMGRKINPITGELEVPFEVERAMPTLTVCSCALASAPAAPQPATLSAASTTHDETLMVFSLAARLLAAGRSLRDRS